MKHAITLAAFCILSACGDKEDSSGDTGEVVSEETDQITPAGRHGVTDVSHLTAQKGV